MDHDTEVSRRVWVAVLLQAYKDFCSPHPKKSSSVVRWLKTPAFGHVCNMAQVNPARAREAFDRLGKFKPAIRKKMLAEIVSSVSGSPNRPPDEGGPATRREPE